MAFTQTMVNREFSTYTLKTAHSYTHNEKFFTTSKTDCHLLCQKVCQKNSVIITNTCVFVVFKAKRELKCQNELFI